MMTSADPNTVAASKVVVFRSKLHAALAPAELNRVGFTDRTIAIWIKYGWLEKTGDGSLEPSKLGAELIAAIMNHRRRPRSPAAHPKRRVRWEGLPPRRTRRHVRVRDTTYRNLPLPNEWLPVLAPLVQVDVAPATVAAPGVDPGVDLGGMLTARMIDVLRRRATGTSLAQLAAMYGVTAERVRQIEYAAIYRLTVGAPAAVDLVAASLTPRPGSFVRVVTTRGIDPAWAWAGFLAITRRGDCRPLRLVRHEDLAWVIVDSVREYEIGRALRCVERDDAYCPVGELAAALGCAPEDLVALPWLFPRLVAQTAGGALELISQARTGSLFVGVARRLAAAGYRRFHFSQLGAALGHVHGEPGRFSEGYMMQVLASIEPPAFTRAGRQGIWSLTEDGDGHYDTQSAVAALMNEADTPLHYRDVCAALRRDVAPGNLKQIMERRPTLYRHLGDGVFAVRGRVYLLDGPLGTWLALQLAERLEGRGFSPRELLSRAERAGFPRAKARGMLGLLLDHRTGARE